MNVALEYTDPTYGAAGLVPATAVASAAQQSRQAVTQQATIGKTLRLEEYAGAAFASGPATALLDPSGVHYGASGLITFPAIYKPYRPGAGTGPVDPEPVRYPPMRQFPPILTS